LDAVLLYFAAVFGAVGAAHATVHLPLHWLLAHCTVTDRRKLYAMRLGVTSERFGARRARAKWAGTPNDVARAGSTAAGSTRVCTQTRASGVLAARPDVAVAAGPDVAVTAAADRVVCLPLRESRGVAVESAPPGVGSWRAAAAPSMATHVRVRCQHTQRAALAVGCAVLVVMTAAAEVAAKPWCAAPTASFNAVLGIALAVDAVMAQPLFVLLVWGWRWTRGDVAPTAPYPIHGVWHSTALISYKKTCKHTRKNAKTKEN